MYVNAMQLTADALVARQRLLNEGSKGMKGNPMTWNGFQEREQAYQASIDGYKAIGQRLNNAASLVFDK